MHMMHLFEGKTGDSFDKAFIEAMLEHHHGAIEMANLAKTNAKHQEIKDMSEGIIAAQSREVDKLKDWKRNWGYE